MSYIGTQPTSSNFSFDQFSGNGSTKIFTLSYAPASVTSIIVTVAGVIQNPSTYSLSSTTLTFVTAPAAGTNNIGVLYLGLPSQVGIPNSGTVGINQLSASGTPSSSTFLRGDNTWAAPSGGLGTGQTWQAVTRTSGTTYTNTTGKPICLNRRLANTTTNSTSSTISINGASAFTFVFGDMTSNANGAAGSVIIPPDATYLVTDASGGVATSHELR